MLRPTALRCALLVVSLLTLASCSGLGDDDSGGTTQTLKIGYVTPRPARWRRSARRTSSS